MILPVIPPVIPKVQVIGVTGIPEIGPGDPLGDIIVDAARRQDTPIETDDAIVVTQKIVSKAEGRLVDLDTVEPSPFALRFAERAGRDPRLVELVLRESRAIVRMDPVRGILITETHHGFVCANAGIDSSNVIGDNVVSLLPVDPARSARMIREEIHARLPNVRVGLIISDTFGRAWREGHVNFAIGLAGFSPIKDYVGTIDAVGKVLHVTRIAVADEIAAASELVTGKAANIPVTLVRGYAYDTSPDDIRSLIRDPGRDLFR